MSTDKDREEPLEPILQNQGFKDIAYAIRKSTVIAQYMTQSLKKLGKRYPYDVRYGLAQELSRAAHSKTRFAAALFDFVAKYDAETAQVEESMMKQGIQFPFPYQRKSVKTTAIDAIVPLMDKYGSEVVAKMLIAYGYARTPYEKDKTQEKHSENPEEPQE